MLCVIKISGQRLKNWNFFIRQCSCSENAIDNLLKLRSSTFIIFKIKHCLMNGLVRFARFFFELASVVLCFINFSLKFGEVAKVTRSTDKETGKRKRFAFVEFNDYDPVDKCIIKVIKSLLASFPFM